MPKTYLFYDIETTGLNPAFDQVLQFAAIRTDENLTELSRHEIQVKLRPDIFPAPEAIITHLIGIQEMQQGVAEVDAICAIHALFNQPETISVGYNTLGFDDEFLRFSFFRNLLPPYTHQYANQCGRMDIFPLMAFYYLFAPTSIQWPYKEDKVSLKLENLSKVNKLAIGQAHNAMVDVEATLALARLLKTNHAIWDYCLGYFNKNKEIERLTNWQLVQKQGLGLYVDPMLGVNNNFMAPVLCLGQHWHYKNQWIFLRLDLKNLSAAKLDDFTQYCWVMKKKMAEPGFLLPMTERYLAKLSAEQLSALKQNQAWLAENSLVFDAICAHFLDYQYPLVAEADVDSILYQNGFTAKNDEMLSRQFHQAPLLKKLELISQFESSELQELAWRLLGRNYLFAMPESFQQDFADYLQVALASKAEEAYIDYRLQRKLSKTQVLATIDDLAMDLNLITRQKELLNEYKQWILAK